jgi:hypothetical protein
LTTSLCFFGRELFVNTEEELDDCRIQGLKYSLSNVYKVRLSIHTQRKVLWSQDCSYCFLVSAMLDRKGVFSITSMLSLTLFITRNRPHWLSTYTSNYNNDQVGIGWREVQGCRYWY